MFLRIVTFHVGTDGIDKSINFFQEKSLSEIRKFAGFDHVELLADREHGMLRVLAYFTARESIDSSEQAAVRLRQQILDEVPGSTLVSVEVYEVALQEGRMEMRRAA